MKKIFFMALFIPAIAHAQFKKGDTFLGGTLSGSSTNRARSDSYKSYKDNSISISPSGGYFVNSRLAIGLNLQYSRSNTDVKRNDDSQTGSQSTAYSAGVLGRYFFPLGEKFMFAVTGNMYYSRVKAIASAPYGGGDNISKSYNMGMTIKPTFLYFPAPRWGFEASIGQFSYVHQQDLLKVSKNDSFTANYGSISLGVAYYFRKP